MQYLLMCYFDENLWDDLPESHREKVMQEYGEFVAGTTKAGQHVAGAKLEPSPTATTLREKNGALVMTDGPFAETKEQLGGYHVIECQNLDEALAIAKRVPTLAVGGTVEVRPIAPVPESIARRG